MSTKHCEFPNIESWVWKEEVRLWQHRTQLGSGALTSVLPLLHGGPINLRFLKHIFIWLDWIPLLLETCILLLWTPRLPQRQRICVGSPKRVFCGGKMGDAPHQWHHWISSRRFFTSFASGSAGFTSFLMLVCMVFCIPLANPSYGVYIFSVFLFFRFRSL